MRKIVTFFAAVPLALGAGAATAAADEPGVEIIVTAPGPDRSADELIGSATAIGREDLVERLAGSLADTLDAEPGVATTYFGPGASRPVLRGLGAERVQVLTNGIGVIDASAASPDHQLATDAIDAEKLEIVRGPVALAYGGQAIGGVVNVIDGLIAEDRPEAAASGEAFGAHNSVNDGTELAAKAQFATGPLVLTLSGSKRDFGDYDIPGFAESSALRALEAAETPGAEAEEETSGVVENSFVNTETLAAGLSFVGDAGFVGVAVRRQSAEYGLPGHGHEHEEEAGGGEPAVEEEGEESPFIDLEQTRIDVRGGWDIGGEVLQKISGALAFADYEHTEFEAPGEAGTRYETDGVEGRLELDHALGAFAGATGLQFMDKELKAFGDEAFITPTETNSVGVFTYQTRDWADGAGVEGGLRFDSTELDNVIAGSRSFDLFSASFGVHRHFNDGWFIGAQLSYTERAPNESELFANGPHLATNQYEIGDPNLSKEQGLNLEGVARWRGESLSFGANVFVTEFEDFVYLTPGVTIADGVETSVVDALPVFLFAQDGARFVGGEIYGALEIDAGPLGADWEFSGGLDYVDAELDSGAPVPYVPPLTLNAGASAEWGSIEIGANATWAGEQDEPGEGALATESYTRLDLRAEYDLSDLGVGADGTELFVEARNVTDEEIRFATSVLKDVAPAPGRNIRAGLRFTF